MSDPLSTLELWALHVVYLLACLGVVAAVICRVDEMKPKRNKATWFVMYLCYAAYALAVLFDAMYYREWDLVHLLGLLALALNLLITMKNWGVGVTPPLSCKPGCGP